VLLPVAEWTSYLVPRMEDVGTDIRRLSKELAGNGVEIEVE
jgi:hypothetical protein